MNLIIDVSSNASKWVRITGITMYWLPEYK